MYALRIKDDNGYTVVEHVANYSDDTVHIDPEYWGQLGNVTEWRKASRVVSYVKEHHLTWTIEEREFDITEIFGTEPG